MSDIKIDIYPIKFPYQVRVDHLLWDKNTGRIYKATQRRKMRDLIYSSGRSIDIPFNGNMYDIGPLNVFLRRLNEIARKKVGSP